MRRHQEISAHILVLLLALMMHSSLNTVWKAKSSLELIGANKKKRRCVFICARSSAQCLCVVFLCVCACAVSAQRAHFVSAIRQLFVDAIRCQSRPSMLLSCCSAGAPQGNVIIPCWLQSTGLTALSVSGETAARGPISYQTPYH